ncbi:hypothetical protein Scep_005201 [Stephania cephalantha]|uniref:Ribulose bisphosphate carboxylase large subunit C-terminal domain-containing protein n=1 Tax=Stephania cephalantha TaxID=152367 RepID=A0AAP0KVK6_9MAGN
MDDVGIAEATTTLKIVAHKKSTAQSVELIDRTSVSGQPIVMQYGSHVWTSRDEARSSACIRIQSSDIELGNQGAEGCDNVHELVALFTSTISISKGNRGVFTFGICPFPTEIFGDDSVLRFGGGTLGHPWGNAPVLVANRVALEACVQARNEGRDLAREGNEIIREASKWSPESVACLRKISHSLAGKICGHERGIKWNRIDGW